MNTCVIRLNYEVRVCTCAHMYVCVWCVSYLLSLCVPKLTSMCDSMHVQVRVQDEGISSLPSTISPKD